MNNILHVSNINKNFGGLAALSNVNLQIEEGKTHAIIGPNGAGKSTLLNVFVGKLIPDTGSVDFKTHSLLGKKPHEINQLGVVRVFQTPEIYQDLSLLENVVISTLARRDGAFSFNPVRGLYDDEQMVEKSKNTLQEVGLNQLSIKADSLSRGDKRRLELAMCLVQDPELLLLDEPTAGMSRQDTDNVIELLKHIKTTGVTKVIIEHDMNVVFSLADKISVMQQGTVIAEGAPEEVRNSEKVKEAYLGGEH